MSPLAIASTLLGMFVIATRLPGVIAPSKFREQIFKYPRSVWPGRVLITIVAIWAGIVLFGAAQSAAAEAAQGPGGAGLWQLAPPAVVIGMPVAYWLVIRYADQFLSLRALAALILLVSNVILRAADRSDSPWRLVVTGLVYLWVVVGIWMAIAPHHFRDLAERMLTSDHRCRVLSLIGVVIGAGLVALGLFVY